MLQRKPWEYTEKSDVQNRGVMMAYKNGYGKLMTDILKKIRCLPGHEPIV